MTKLSEHQQPQIFMFFKLFASSSFDQSHLLDIAPLSTSFLFWLQTGDLLRIEDDKMFIKAVFKLN